MYWRYGRSVAGNRATISANLVQGERYSMVVALSLDGYEAAHIVRESFVSLRSQNTVCTSGDTEEPN
jgi:hypothetical protein